MNSSQAVESLRVALLAEAARRAPSSLEGLSGPPSGGLTSVSLELAARLLASRADLLPWLEAAPAIPRVAAAWAADPAGHLAARTLRWLQGRSQFLPLDGPAEAALSALHRDALREGAAALRAARDPAGLAAALEAVLVRYVAGLAALAGGLERPADGGPALREVVAAEYDPALQLRVLGLDAARLAGPILDLGCGAEARLVRWLRARGLQAVGIDRMAEPAEGILRADWLDVPLVPGSLGTALSHLGFSLHFLHHHLRPGGEAARYARRYMDVLRALRPGGLFAYAPGLPFVEEHLPTEAWRVERTPVPAPPPDLPGADALPWYAARVIRLGG
jgi:hypothetical protein